MIRTLRLLAIAASLVLAATAVQAQPVPEALHFQAYVSDANGPLDGDVELVLSLWNGSADDADMLWSEAQTVTANQGVVGGHGARPSARARRSRRCPTPWGPPTP